jgi:hypothetical protein
MSVRHRPLFISSGSATYSPQTDLRQFESL